MRYVIVDRGMSMCYVQRIAQINCVHMMYISSLSHPSPPIDGGDRGMGRSRGSPPSMLLRGLPCFIVCFSNCTIIENFFGCVPLDSPCRDEFLLFSNIFGSVPLDSPCRAVSQINLSDFRLRLQDVYGAVIVLRVMPISDMNCDQLFFEYLNTQTYLET